MDGTERRAAYARQAGIPADRERPYYMTGRQLRRWWKKEFRDSLRPQRPVPGRVLRGPEPVGEVVDEVHVCRPDAEVYYCPVAGGIESNCHGGHDECCYAPEMHRPVTRTP